MEQIDMAKRIAEAKRKAEEEYEQKKEKSLAFDADVRKMFTAEDIERMLKENEEFRGKTADMSKIQRYGAVLEEARWLEAHSIEVVSIDAERINPCRANAVVTIDLRRLGSLRGEELERFSKMLSYADTVFFSGIKDEVIRITLGMERIWLK